MIECANCKASITDRQLLAAQAGGYVQCPHCRMRYAVMERGIGTDALLRIVIGVEFMLLAIILPGVGAAWWAQLAIGAVVLFATYKLILRYTIVLKRIDDSAPAP